MSLGTIFTLPSALTPLENMHFKVEKAEQPRTITVTMMRRPTDAQLRSIEEGLRAVAGMGARTINHSVLPLRISVKISDTTTYESMMREAFNACCSALGLPLVENARD